MSKYLEEATRTNTIREKVAFTTGAGKVLGETIRNNPFLSIGAIGTAGAFANKALESATGTIKRPLDTESYKLDRAMHSGVGGLLDRIQADEMVAKSLASNVTDRANDIVNEALSSGMKSYKKMVNAPKQKAILKDLLETDEMLMEADPQQVADIFNTMVDVAPKMTKYKDAVRSFLRQGIAHEGGLDPVTIGELAKAEARLSGKGLNA